MLGFIPSGPRSLAQDSGINAYSTERTEVRCKGTGYLTLAPCRFGVDDGYGGNKVKHRYEESR